MKVLFTLSEIDDLEQTVQLAMQNLVGRGWSPRLVPLFRVLESTGIARWVRDEIGLVLRAPSDSALVDQFFTDWDLWSVADVQVDQLSGGWRKFLYVALHVAVMRPDRDCPLLVCAGHHLAPRLISRIAQQVTSMFDNAAFLEFDVNPLVAIIPDPEFVALHNDGVAVANQNFRRG